MLEHTRNLVELAGAAPLAGALQLRERLAGRRFVVCSGRELTPEQLARSRLGLTRPRGSIQVHHRAS